MWSNGEGCLASFLKRDLLLQCKQEKMDWILCLELLLPPHNIGVFCSHPCARHGDRMADAIKE